jgi:hypothetical protein
LQKSNYVQIKIALENHMEISIDWLRRTKSACGPLFIKMSKKKLSKFNKIELLKTTFHRYQITAGNKAICLLIAIIRHLTDQTMYNTGQVRYSKYGGSVCN